MQSPKAEEAPLFWENEWYFVDQSMDISQGIPEDALGMLSLIRGRGVLRVATEPYFPPQELIESGSLDVKDALIGYVAAMETPEVISGYTAFLLGVRSVVPEAVMRVRYTGSWFGYIQEKQSALSGKCVFILSGFSLRAA